MLSARTCWVSCTRPWNQLMSRCGSGNAIKAGLSRLLLQLLIGASVELDLAEPWHRPGPVFGDPRLAPYRLGQQSFQAVVLEAYHGHCAITQTKIRPVLQAAHIRPVTEGGEHRLDNGLLL